MIRLTSKVLRIRAMQEETKNLSEMMQLNEHYKAIFDKAGLSAQPGKRIAILTCMDCRLNPYEFAGLKDGEAHIIRNAHCSSQHWNDDANIDHI